MRVADDPEDPDNRLLKHGIINVHGEIDRHVAERVVTRLLQVGGSASDVVLHIDSIGGSIIDSYVIIETMRRCRCRIETICTDNASGTALLILANGYRGRRRASRFASMRFARFQIDNAHAPDAAGQQMRMSRKIAEEFAALSGKSAEFFSQAMVDERELDPDEAVGWGLIDEVVGPPGE